MPAKGFTLIELMMVIAIIAILSAVGIPAYQHHLQKAALVDMLQAMTPYKTAVELCLLELGSAQGCNSNNQGIPGSVKTRYVSTINVNNGTITLDGQQTLQGLTVHMLPQVDTLQGITRWQRRCNSSNDALIKGCQEVFRFDEANAS